MTDPSLTIREQFYQVGWILVTLVVAFPPLFIAADWLRSF